MAELFLLPAPWRQPKPLRSAAPIRWEHSNPLVLLAVEAPTDKPRSLRAPVTELRRRFPAFPVVAWVKRPAGMPPYWLLRSAAEAAIRALISAPPVRRGSNPWRRYRRYLAGYGRRALVLRHRERSRFGRRNPDSEAAGRYPAARDTRRSVREPRREGAHNRSAHAQEHCLQRWRDRFAWRGTSNDSAAPEVTADQAGGSRP